MYYVFLIIRRAKIDFYFKAAVYFPFGVIIKICFLINPVTDYSPNKIYQEIGLFVFSFLHIFEYVFTENLIIDTEFLKFSGRT